MATRPAFRGRSTKPLQTWTLFLENVQHLDGVLAGDTLGTPAVVRMAKAQPGRVLAILPFGPALWICLE